MKHSYWYKEKGQQNFILIERVERSDSLSTLKFKDIESAFNVLNQLLTTTDD